ncbi:CPBP family intramembrane metalloprotease [Candidatus Collierbacteria bacterium]|nr:CPBP family intramembrane metalloprotease [Candidatus Collierbacteria bacterium]
MSKNLKRLVFYYLFIFIAWAIFRYFSRLPEVIEELWFKPVLWLVPLFWWQISDGEQRITLFKGEINKTLFWGLGIGLIYYSMVRLVTRSSWFELDFDRLGIGLATAVVEEVTFAGIVLPRLIRELKKEGVSLCLMALMFALIRLPINVFIYQLPWLPLLGAFLLAFFVGLVNGFARLKANNTLAPVLAHFFYLQAVL